MSKDEIKERLDANRGAYHPQIVSDYEFLLSKLEIAEKALEECKQYDEDANCHWCGGKIKEITTEALQQLRS